MFNSDVKLRVVATLAIVGVTVFVLAYGAIVVVTWNSTSGAEVEVSQFQALIGNLFAGLVGTVAAFAIGAPEPDHRAAEFQGLPSRGFLQKLADYVRRLGQWLWGSNEVIGAIVAPVFLISYFGMALAAGVTVWQKQEIAPDMLANFATIAAGVGIAAVLAMFAREG